MVKLLIKKQLREIFRSWFVNQKTNQRRSKAGVIGFLLLFVVLMVGVLGGIFTVLSFSLAGPLSAAGVGWLHFSIMTLIAILLGVFGSVFNTYSGLYLAKDNDLLLSLPIPPRALILSRLLSVYLMGLMYSACVTVPAVVVWWIKAGVTLPHVVGGIILILIVSLIVLILSCLLGWVVAKVSLRLKRKSFAIVLISLAFIGLYYFFYFRASILIQDLIANVTLYGDAVRGKAYPVYLFGCVGVGDWLAILIVAAVVAALTALTWLLLSKSFLGIATATAPAPKAVYHEKRAELRSASRALLSKERMRFTSSPNYMLNCGLGTLLLALGAIALLWKGWALAPLLNGVFEGIPHATAAVFCTLVCYLAAMNDMSTPAVSMEGKNLWLAQSLPIRPWEALRAKLSLQLLLTLPLALLCGVCAAVVLHASAIETAMLVLVPAAFAVLMDALGLTIGTVRANVHWTNETTPIKQSLAIMLILFGGWILALLPAAYLLVGNHISFPVYLVLLLAVYGGGALLLILWLRGRGAERFAWLS